MWLDICIWLCGWTKSLLVSQIGVCVLLSIRSHGQLVVVGLSVLKEMRLRSWGP